MRDRRKRREQQEARVRKTAEKFLLTKLKQHALNLATAPVNALPNTDSGPSTSAPASGPSVSAAAGDGAGPSTSQPPQHNEDQGPSVAEFEAALAVQDDDGDFDLDLLLPEVRVCFRTFLIRINILFDVGLYFDVTMCLGIWCRVVPLLMPLYWQLCHLPFS